MLLKVVGYYDLSVLSMSVMGFQKKFVGGWGELYPIFFGFWEFFNFTKPLTIQPSAREMDECSDIDSCTAICVACTRRGGAAHNSHDLAGSR